MATTRLLTGCLAPLMRAGAVPQLYHRAGGPPRVGTQQPRAWEPQARGGTGTHRVYFSVALESFCASFSASAGVFVPLTTACSACKMMSRTCW